MPKARNIPYETPQYWENVFWRLLLETLQHA